MKILLYPNPILNKKCKAIDKITPELQQTAKDMYDVMIKSNGVGLAAPQVGLDIRLLVLDEDGNALYMFNPHLMKKSKETQYETEGCLSFPGDWKKIKRSKEVTVKYRDLNNKMVYKTLTGIMSIAFQHELNHLDGILFIDLEEKKD